MRGGKNRSTSRRKFLKLGVGGVGAIGTGIGGVLISERLADTSLGDYASERLKESMYYKGVSDNHVQDDKFYDFLNDRFPENQVRRLDFGPNMIADLRYIEGCEFSEHSRKALEDEFKENGVDALFLEYEEVYPREEFFKNYSMDDTDIIGSGEYYQELLDIQDGFWGDKTEELLKDVAIQVISVPGTRNGETSFIKTSKGDAVGAAKGSRATVLYRDASVSQRRTTKHEIGHTLSLGHTDGDDVMTNNDVIGSSYRDWQWEKIREQLS